MPSRAHRGECAVRGLGGFVLNRLETVEAHLKPQGILQNSAALKEEGREWRKDVSLCLCLEEDPGDQSELLFGFLGTVSNRALVDNGLYWGQALSLHALSVLGHSLSPHFVTCQGGR